MCRGKKKRAINKSISDQKIYHEENPYQRVLKNSKKYKIRLKPLDKER